MRNLLTILMTLIMLSFSNFSFAQDDTTEEVDQLQEDTSSTTMMDSASEETSNIQIIEEEEIEEVVEESQSFHYAIKDQFIQGGWQFMGIVLLCLILGLAVAIERIITLNLATTNTKKLLSDIEDALKGKMGLMLLKKYVNPQEDQLLLFLFKV